MLNAYYQKDIFKDEAEVRELVDQLTDNLLSSIDGLSIDFLRLFKDIIDFDVIFNAPYNNYNKDKKIVKEFYRIAEEQFQKIIKI